MLYIIYDLISYLPSVGFGLLYKKCMYFNDR